MWMAEAGQALWSGTGDPTDSTVPPSSPSSHTGFCWRHCNKDLPLFYSHIPSVFLVGYQNAKPTVCHWEARFQLASNMWKRVTQRSIPFTFPLKQMFKHLVEENRVTFISSTSHPNLAELLKKRPLFPYGRCEIIGHASHCTLTKQSLSCKFISKILVPSCKTSCDAIADARYKEKNVNVCGEGEGDIRLTKHHHKCSHFSWTL